MFLDEFFFAIWMKVYLTDDVKYSKNIVSTKVKLELFL